MNPILSSTIDFDNYLQDRLQSSRSKNRSSLSSSKVDTGATRNTSTPQQPHSSKAPSHNHHRPARPLSASKPRPSSAVDIEASNQFLSLNANKYELNAQRSTPRPLSTNVTKTSTSKMNGTNNYDRELAVGYSDHQDISYGRKERAATNAKDVDTLEFVHSWKQYVRHPSPSFGAGGDTTSTVHIPSSGNKAPLKFAQRQSGPSMTSRTNDNNFLFEDYEEEEPQPKSPLRYHHIGENPPRLSHINTFLTSPHKHTSSNQRYNSSSESKSQRVLMDEDVSMPFIGVKFRVKVLTKFFLAWKEQAKSQQVQFYHMQSGVALHHDRLLCQFVLRHWFFSSIAEKILKKKLRIGRRKMFISWRKKTAMVMRRSYKSDRFRYEFVLLKAFRMLKKLLLVQGIRNKRKLQSIKAYKHRMKTLLLTTFHCWKSEYRSYQRQKSLQDEQYERKSKIQSFIQRLDKQPALKEESHGQDNKQLAEPNTAKSATTHNRSSSAVRNNSRSSTQHSANFNAKVTGTQATSAKSGRTVTPNRVWRGAIPSTIAPQSSASVSRSALSMSTGHNSAVMEESPEPKKSPRPMPLPSLEVVDQDDISKLPPPPSYRHFVEQGSPKPQRGDEAFSMQSLSNNLNEIIMEKPESNKELSRKDKIIMLRQQAMQRVQEKQKEQEQKLKEKLSKEAEEAEKIRQEARIKKEQEKQKSARMLALMEEQNRKLKIADSFRRKNLLIRYGLSPWNRYMDLLWNHGVKADKFYHKKLLIRFWNALSSYAKSLKTERVRSEYRQMIFAATFHKRHLLAKTWKAWRLYRKELKAKSLSISGMFTKVSLLKKCMKGWKIAFERSQRETLRQLRSVKGRGDLCNMKYYFRLWSNFINERRIDREISMRSEMKWREVQGWIHK